jgi:adenylyltransferase/sulfurtransferase
VFRVKAPAGTLATCETAGVLASTVVMVAAFQWTEAVKLLIGAREQLNLDLVYFDVWENERVDSARTARSPGCLCCVERRFEFLDADVTSRTASLCGRNAVQVSPGRKVHLDLAELAERLDGLGTLSTTRFLLRLGVDGYEVCVFPDGRAIIKGTDDLGTARSVYARYVGA